MKTQHYYREELARWMVANGFATGHGDTFENLLGELRWQVEEMRANAIQYRHMKMINAANQCV